MAQYTSFNPCLSQKAFVYLDKQTAKDGNTCNIVGAEDGSLRVTFDYSKVVAKHFIHETRTWLQLQNDAAVAGGALDGNIVSGGEVLTETGKLLADELQAEDSMNWRQRRSSSEDLFIPLFCTADVPLEVRLLSPYNFHDGLT